MNSVTFMIQHSIQQNIEKEMNMPFSLWFPNKSVFYYFS